MTPGMLAEPGWSERSLKLQIPILISSHFAEYGFLRNGFSVDNFLLLPEVNFLNHIFSSIFFCQSQRWSFIANTFCFLNLWEIHLHSCFILWGKIYLWGFVVQDISLIYIHISRHSLWKRVENAILKGSLMNNGCLNACLFQSTV